MAARPKATTARRKTPPAGARVGGRSARVVAEVMRATAEELARVGYAALRMEDVARVARVNKTTVYRRWPTKMRLVAEAMRHERERCVVVPDTGSLREDLRAMLADFTEQGRSPLARAWLAEIGNPEVQTIMEGSRHFVEAQWTRVIARGMARGELPPDTSPMFLVEVVVAPVVGRLLRREELPGDEFCTKLIDLVLAGTLAVARSATGGLVRARREEKGRSLRRRAAR